MKNFLLKKNNFSIKFQKNKIELKRKKKFTLKFYQKTNNFFLLIFINKIKILHFFIYNLFLQFFFFIKHKWTVLFISLNKKTLNENVFFIIMFFIVLFLDGLITDDEPLWEPIEWSLVQTWLFFIFTFAWIAENLITSRFGSYTGRDKRVWFAWYKSFWLIELCYVISLGSASMFVIVPFYYELTYSVTFIFSWWNWYNRIFFFKFLTIYTIIILLAQYFLINIKWLNWKKNFFFIILIFSFLAYLLYTQFIISFFSYFTDPVWYQKTRFVDLIQLSHEPLKWGWGPAKRDHFTYHRVSTVFWFKNDGPFAEAFLLFNCFFFIFLFFLIIYWVVLIRKTYATKEISFTFSVYCVSSLKQFYYFFFLFYLLILISFIVCYWRFPIEFIWLINTNSWIVHFIKIFFDYFSFIFFKI